MTATLDNPLLDFSGLARFDRIRPEHVTPAIDALLADARRAVVSAARADAPAHMEHGRRAARRGHRPAVHGPGARWRT